VAASLSPVLTGQAMVPVFPFNYGIMVVPPTCGPLFELFGRARPDADAAQRARRRGRGPHQGRTMSATVKEWP